LLTEKGKKGEIYNVGSGKTTNISEIIDLMRSYIAMDAEIKSAPGDRKEIDHQQADIRKLGEAGIEISFTDIRKTVKDMLDHLLITSPG
jgi:nucleoside-diphosphate-sugar epimerase